MRRARGAQGAGRLGATLGIALAAWLLAGAADGRLVAERITPENIARLRVGGPDSDGGVGDWALGNGTLCAVISDPTHESPLSDQGGVLVDLGHCGRDDDQWSVLEPLTNLSRSQVIPIDAVVARSDDDFAEIETRGEREGVRDVTRFRLQRDEPDLLRVATRLTRVADGAPLYAFAHVVLRANGQLRPFALDTRHPERSPGFDHPAGDPDSPFSMLRAIVGADWHGLIGGDALEPQISYSLRMSGAHLERADGSREDVPTFSLNGESYTLLGAFSRPFYVGGSHELPGFLELAQLPLLDLDEGDSLVLEREIRIGSRADAASLTDALWAASPRVSGRVDDATARLHVSTASGQPMTEIRPEPDGRFALHLPDGAYRIEARGPGARHAEATFQVAGEDLALPPIALGTPAVLELPRGRTLRLIFLPEAGSPDPALGNDLLDFRVGGRAIRNSLEAPVVSLAGAPGDPTEVVLPPGRYRVVATRGPEYDVREARVELAAGSRATLEIEDPPRVATTPGWIPADFHVHSAESFDSALPLARQLVAFAANGGELMVSSEHDRVIDPAPTVARLGLGDRIRALGGVEITTAFPGGETPHTIGHWNAFPLRRDPDAYRGGAPAAEGRRPREVIAELWDPAGPPIVQLNHPRGNDGAYEDQRYLTHLGVVGKPYDPARPFEVLPNRVLVERDPATGLRDLDFDAVELLNGASLPGYRLVRADWLSWLLQGEFRTGTGNSDSHRAGEVPALPRNYLRSAAATPAEIQPADVVSAVHRGQLWATTGPLLDVSLSGKGLGELHTGQSGLLRVHVDAAPWVPVAELRVLVDGALVARQEIAAGDTRELPLAFAHDSFVTVEVQGPREGVYAEILPGFTPFAFTNPIFVDADGDGHWSAPGLGSAPPPAISDPLAP